MSKGIRGRPVTLSAIRSMPQLMDLETALRALCERNQFIRLAYGSMVREDYGPESDLDVLVEVEDGHGPGFGFFDLQDELRSFAAGLST